MRRTMWHGVAAAALALLAGTGAGAAQAAVPAPVMHAGPQLGRARAALTPAGHLVVDVPVRWSGVRPRRARWLDRGRARLDGRVAVTRGGARAEARTALPLAHRGRGALVLHRLDLGPARGVGPGDVVRLRVRARSELRPRGRGRVAVGATATTTLAVPVAATAPPPPSPSCAAPGPLPARAGRPTVLQVVCPGVTAPLRLAAAGRGRVTPLPSPGPGRALAAYAPPAGFTGADRLTLAGAAAAPQPVRVVVRPFTLRAIGDSVTAGYGFLGDGTPWSIVDLPSCIPPTPFNDRCSSNSPNGVGSGNPVGWSPDFGLSNGVAWPAQFARSAGIGASGYANYAVSGATPADWDTGGQFNEVLAQIVAGDPDLTVMTLGANPLLDAFLEGKGIECAATFSDAALVACVQGLVTADDLAPRLASVLQQLLAAPGNRVVVSTYHLAVPSVTVFSAHQIEVIFDTVDDVIEQTVRAAPGFGARLFLMSPPRFDVGRPPGTTLCPGVTGTVDGLSHQSRVSQDVLALDPFLPFCGSTDYWIISADTGIHPSVAGHAQFAAALAAVVQANGLMPAGAASAP